MRASGGPYSVGLSARPRLEQAWSGSSVRTPESKTPPSRAAPRYFPTTNQGFNIMTASTTSRQRFKFIPRKLLGRLVGPWSDYDVLVTIASRRSVTRDQLRRLSGKTAAELDIITNRTRRRRQGRAQLAPHQGATGGAVRGPQGRCLLGTRGVALAFLHRTIHSLHPRFSAAFRSNRAALSAGRPQAHRTHSCGDTPTRALRGANKEILV